jgi:hypothetical protein
MTQAGFEPAIQASERPQIHALDRDKNVNTALKQYFDMLYIYIRRP